MAVPNSSSVYTNPAGIGFLSTSSISSGFYRHFDIEGFNTVGIWGNLIKQKVGFGFSIDKFGDQLYQESRVGMAVSKKIDRISFGLKISYLNTGIKDLSSRQTLLTEFGIITMLSKKIFVGFHAINLTRAELYDSQYLPTLLSIGLCFKPAIKMNITSQIDYNIINKPTVRIGMKYIPKENFEIISGVNPYLNSIYFGTSFFIKKYNFTYATSINPGLGLSNQVSLTLNLKNKK